MIEKIEQKEDLKPMSIALTGNLIAKLKTLKKQSKYSVSAIVRQILEKAL